MIRGNKGLKRVLSGMRPTGPLHLGHLVGALKNWVSLQAKYECLFMVADWHAHMSEYEHPEELKNIPWIMRWIGSAAD